MRSQAQARPGALGIEELERRLMPSAVPLLQESFDGTRSGSLPSGWAQWNSSGAASFAVSPSRPFSGPAGLGSNAQSSVAARAWVATPEPADVQVTADVFVNGL